MLSLCRWIAEYYVVPLGWWFAPRCRRCSPAARRRGRPSGRNGSSSCGATYPRCRSASRPSPAPRGNGSCTRSLESVGGHAEVSHVTGQLGFSPAVVTASWTRGLSPPSNRTSWRATRFAARARPRPPHTPTDAQREAIAAIVAAQPGEAVLLHGVTGSGKTLVYIELLREIVDVAARAALVLVPEIALTPQAVDRFRARFGDARGGAAQRALRRRALRRVARLRRGEATIAVGARSAVFAPLADLGAIIVDEEHEASYKQGETPRYHAREVADRARARAAAPSCVLGSATPSLESWHNARAGKYRASLSLPERVGGGRCRRWRSSTCGPARATRRRMDLAPAPPPRAPPCAAS